MGEGLDVLVLGEAVGQGPAQVAGELVGPVRRGQDGDGDQAAVAGGQAGRFQTSPNRTSSVSWTILGAKPPSSRWAGVCCSSIAGFLFSRDRLRSRVVAHSSGMCRP